jgi:serine/threonine protein kinase
VLVSDPLRAGREGETVAGGFVFEELIASGGMAIVYRGRAPDGAPIAIKVMRAELLEEPTVRARFVREGKLCQAFTHPGVPRIHGVWDMPDGTVAIAMELLAGETVGQRAKRFGGYLPPQEVLAIVDRVLDVLEAAHARKIIHRDIKPDNVFLTASGDLKLLDFGVASAREQDGEKLTHAGYALGTPAFMSPEQAQGRWEDVDGRTDLWAVGATMWALLVGEPPHQSDSPIQELVAAATMTVPPIETRVPGLRPAIRSLVDRALERDAEKRYDDATGMRVAVRAAWLALGGPATMQLVWDRIASEVVTSSPEIDLARRYDSGHHTVPDVRTVDVSTPRLAAEAAPRPPRARGSGAGWSVPPPSDVARIVTRRDLETSQEFAALEPLLRTNKPRKGTSSGERPAVRVASVPSRAPARIAIAVVVLVIVAAIVLARVLGLG